MRSLIGKPVTLTISDPWDFGTVHGSGPFPATVVDVPPNTGERRGEALLVKLERALWYQGNYCEHLIATPAPGGDGLEKLGANGGLACNFVSISPQGARSSAPFDLTWWRGWGTLRGVLEAAWLDPPRDEQRGSVD
jgi:hypothetical protein